MIGTKNESADKVKRIDDCWSDTKLIADCTGYGVQKFLRDNGGGFPRLKCENCGRTEFEILITGEWETSARCKCGFYYIVHTG